MELKYHPLMREPILLHIASIREDAFYCDPFCVSSSILGQSAAHHRISPLVADEVPVDQKRANHYVIGWNI